MHKDTSDIFALIHAGIYDSRLPSDDSVNWTSIERMAEQQTILALIFDAIQRLPKEQYPNMDTLMDWLGQTSYIETQNESVNQDLHDLLDFLNTKGIASRLMKGQGIAQYYPNPFHRQSGDIDLFVGERQYEEVKKLIAEKGIAIELESRKDFSFHWGATLVECHKWENHLYAPMLNKRFQKTCRAEEWTDSPAITISTKMDGGEKFRVPIFNPTFNAFYVFIHFYHHFLHVGVGLRQIIDWMLLLHHEQNNIDWNKLYGYVAAVHAKRAWKSFYWLCVSKLGLPRIDSMEKVFNFNACIRVDSDVIFLIEDILSVGNFGIYGESLQQRDYSKGIRGNVSSFWALTKRMCHTFKFGRQEVMAYPIYKLCANFGLVKK